MRPEGAAAAGDVTVEETDALDCGVCFLPLKPPIFQCNVGHVVCSACRDKLKATGKCYVCGINTGGYSRCHAMERLVESIHFPCPNAIHGCTARTTYYDQHFHCQTCPHRPCHCPSETCGFVGSTAALLDHFNRAHGWPCTTKVKAATMNYKDDDDYEFKIQLHDGFNFILADCATADSKQGTGLYLFLLNVVRQQLGCTITVLCIHPQHDETSHGCGLSPLKEIQCELSYSRHVYIKSRHGSDKLIKHYQESMFEVECTDLSNGLPNPDECFQFVVPKSVLAGGNTIEVGGRIVISWSMHVA